MKDPKKVKIKTVKMLRISKSTKKVNTKIETPAIIILLVQAAKFKAKVISPAVNGAYRMSTILP